ncbi:hypothetical protein AZI86_18410 [Bdellovibrio bacteriovorus]|uniref:Uncharacterized protein n=2 Tax=Bdellovibrio bacteriovorus TaxID=959 RepID=A0A150WEW1_BDEBC|nr:hypothetical protein AZI86_18410 [Bdellovibrio bacteriovorus]
MGKYSLITVFLFLSLNRIAGGYLHLAGLSPEGFNSPLFSPFGVIGALGLSPLPRAYTGLGFSDGIDIYIKSAHNDYLIDLDFKAIDQQARGHLYKYDVYLHSLFWPIKAPDIEAHAGQILKYLVCQDQDFLTVNGIADKPMMALIARKNVITKNTVWTKEVLCVN